MSVVYERLIKQWYLKATIVHAAQILSFKPPVRPRVVLVPVSEVLIPVT